MIEADGEDSPIVNGIPQGIILVLQDATVIEAWQKAGAILTRTTPKGAILTPRNQEPNQRNQEKEAQ